MASPLRLIKTIHTLVWAVMAAAILYTLYAGIVGRFGLWLWLSIGLVMLEVVVLAFNRMTCPLTPLARNYTADKKDNFDIYLPEWLARHNKIIFGSIFAVALLLVAVNAVA